jgi:hypothetical protein
MGSLPVFQQIVHVLLDQSLNITKFVRPKTKIIRQSHWGQPKLARNLIAIDVNMRRFLGFMRVEIHAVRTTTAMPLPREDLDIPWVREPGFELPRNPR